MINLEEIEARANAATPGPWEAFDNYISTGDEIFADVHSSNPMYGDASNDTQFIAHAREDVPSLLEEVKRLRSLLGRTLVYVDPRAALNAEIEKALTGVIP